MGRPDGSLVRRMYQAAKFFEILVNGVLDKGGSEDMVLGALSQKGDNEVMRALVSAVTGWRAIPERLTEDVVLRPCPQADLGVRKKAVESITDHDSLARVAVLVADEDLEDITLARLKQLSANDKIFLKIATTPQVSRTKLRLARRALEHITSPEVLCSALGLDDGDLPDYLKSVVRTQLRKLGIASPVKWHGDHLFAWGFNPDPYFGGEVWRLVKDSRVKVRPPRFCRDSWEETWSSRDFWGPDAEKRAFAAAFGAIATSDAITAREREKEEKRMERAEERKKEKETGILSAEAQEVFSRRVEELAKLAGSFASLARLLRVSLAAVVRWAGRTPGNRLPKQRNTIRLALAESRLAGKDKVVCCREWLKARGFPELPENELLLAIKANEDVLANGKTTK